MTELADGKLRLDRPAPDVVRLTIDNPAKRNALDHAILDAIAETVPQLERALPADHRRGPGVLGRLRHRRPAARRVRPRGRVARRPPVPRRDRRARGVPLPVRRGAQRARDRRRARAGAVVRPAAGLRGREARDAAGAARARLLAHGAAQVRRRDRRRADARAVPHRPQHHAAQAERVGTGQRGRRARPAGARARSSTPREIAALAPLSQAGNKRVLRELLAAEGELDPETERELVELRESCFRSDGLLRGRARVRGEATAGVARQRSSWMRPRTACCTLPLAARSRPPPRRAPTPAEHGAYPADRVARVSRPVGMWWSRRAAHTACSCPPRGRTGSRGTRSASRARTATGVAGAPTGSCAPCSACCAEYRLAHPCGAAGRASATCRAATAASFGRRFGGLGHASHQNGLDVDVYYPRIDGRELRALHAGPGRPRARAGARRPLRRGGREGALRRPEARAAAGRERRRPRSSTTTTTCTSGSRCASGSFAGLRQISGRHRAAPRRARRRSAARARRARRATTGSTAAGAASFTPASDGPTSRSTRSIPVPTDSRSSSTATDCGLWTAWPSSRPAAAEERITESAPLCSSRWTFSASRAAADDRRVGVELAGGERDEHRGVVAVGRDDHRGGLADAGRLEHRSGGRPSRGSPTARRGWPPRSRRRPPSTTTICSRGVPRASSVSTAARPLVPNPITMVWSFKPLLQTRSRNAVRRALGQHLDGGADQDDQEHDPRGVTSSVVARRVPSVTGVMSP